MSQGWKPTNPERWRKATLPKLHKISVVETWGRPPYAFHLLPLVRERGKSYNLSALRSRNRNGVVPILSSLIRFSRANPSRGSGQDKTRIGENRASTI